MEFILTIIGLIVIIFYCSLILAFTRGWNKCTATPVCNRQDLPNLTCIIALRNEENNVNKLFINLNQLDYPQNKIEFILIDDHSTDNTYNEIQNLKKDFNYNLSLTSNEGRGKKAAIAKGISLAKYENIVLTDADCTPHENWLLSIGSCFFTEKPDMIVAPVFIKDQSSLLSYFQSVDFISLITSTAGAIGINRPIMCNGANLAYKKEAYLKVKDKLKEEFLSGDDVFLLHAIKGEGGKVTFLKDDKAVVQTEPEKNTLSFLNQRVRWASKSKGYTDYFTLITAWLVFLSNLAVISSVLLISVYPAYSKCILFAWGLKVLVDANIVSKGLRFFKLKNKSMYFLLTFLIYPLYIGATVVWAAFGHTNWRGRSVK
ncbi:glycosyltransferase [Saccharicrinis aurantiacus]|uniref:glycosyltransferase n=1 Tax=Saccharicrinis aurantiacus TaxID=1849719 RepID=UPI0024905D39|nr:glycosyltransferase [Saccharicrinis aurantiacus]